MPSLIKRIFKHHWIDLVVCVALPLPYLMPNNGMTYFPMHLLILFFIAPIWLIIRLSFQMYRLAEIARREEVAITLMPAHQYLRSQLRLPIIMVLLSIFPGWLITSLVLGQLFQGFLETIVMLLVLVGLIIPPLAGAFHLLRSLCFNRSPISIYLSFIYYLPFPVIAIVIPTLAPNGWWSIAAYPRISSFLLIIILLACIILTFINWKRACAAYYTFE